MMLLPRNVGVSSSAKHSNKNITSHTLFRALPERSRCALMTPAAIANGNKKVAEDAKKVRPPHAGHSSDEVYALRAERVKAYVEGWRSDVDMSNRFNVMNILLMVALFAPLVGLAFAWATYGSLWGMYSS